MAGFSYHSLFHRARTLVWYLKSCCFNETFLYAVKLSIFFALSFDLSVSFWKNLLSPPSLSLSFPFDLPFDSGNSLSVLAALSWNPSDVRKKPLNEESAGIRSQLAWEGFLLVSSLSLRNPSDVWLHPGIRSPHKWEGFHLTSKAWIVEGFDLVLSISVRSDLRRE